MSKLFSIIMPIYGVESWLREAIESIVSQKNVNFLSDIEIILINDKSPDNSIDICKEYVARYPNIKYIENNVNLGASASRNKGLRIATGKYVNFLDPDDKLSLNTLYEVKKFFENSPVKLAHVSIPLEFFGRIEGKHPKYKLLGKKNRIIDLEHEPFNFILSAASSFYLRKNIKNNFFDENMIAEEDTLFNFKLYESCKNIGYVCENKVVYHYRQRVDGSSQVNKNAVNPKAYKMPIYLLQNIKLDENSPLFYELIIYELRSRIKKLSFELFDNKKEFEEIYNSYKFYIKKIPVAYLFNSNSFLDFDLRMIFLKVFQENNLQINNDGFLVVDDVKYLKCNELPLDIKRFEIVRSKFIIEFLFNDYDLNDFEVVLMGQKNKNLLPVTESYYVDSCFIKKIGNWKVTNKLLYGRFEIPLTLLDTYKFYFKRKSNGYLHVVNKIRTYSESPFLPNAVFSSSRFRLYSEQLGLYVSFFNKKIVIAKSSFFEKLKSRIYALRLIYKKHNTFKWMRLLKAKKPKYWLFNDRPINANDNSEQFFSYINQKYPKIAKKCYFVLSKDSKDIQRLKKIGNVVVQNSIKHKYLYLNSKYIFTSHLANSFFKPFSLKFYKYYNDLIETKIIWLQHGITMNDIEIAANKFSKNIHKVVIAAKYEKDIFTDQRYFFQEKDIYQTGFTRYDKLEQAGSRSNKTILIMPTWRSYLSGKILSSGLHEEIDGFQNSNYYYEYSKLLGNDRTFYLLKKYGYTINFVLHPGFKQYEKFFKKFENSLVKVTGDLSVSYSELFNSSSILITDYSSVFFDFAYTGKPTLFFQFDHDDFYGKHYKKGYFDFNTMAPGPLTDNVDTLLTELENIIINGEKVGETYCNRIKSIYNNIDKNNSKRLLAEVLNYE